MSVSNCCPSSPSFEVTLSKFYRKTRGRFFDWQFFQTINLFALVIAVGLLALCVKGNEEISGAMTKIRSCAIRRWCKSLRPLLIEKDRASRVDHYDPGFDYTIYNIITISNNSSSSCNDNSRSSSNNNNGNNMIVVIVVPYEKKRKKIHIRKT